VERILCRLCVGVKEDPFPQARVEGGRDFIHSWLSQHCPEYAGSRVLEGDVAEGQPFLLNLVYFLLKEMGDADYAVFNSFKTGVTLGVLQPMPRTPAVFEEQLEW
jgi:hypothetical protein